MTGPAQQKAQPKATLYIRVSTGPQEAGTSLESQYTACRAKAASLGAQVVGVHQDVQSGADYLSRQGLQQALLQIETGEADTLIIYDMSRSSRDSEHQQLIKKRVLAARARLVFCTLELGDLSSPEGGLAFGVTGIFAEYERHKIRERTHNGSKARARSGIQPTRAMRPFGYTLVTKEHVMDGLFTKDQAGTYHVVEAEAAIVRQIFQWYLEGQSLRAIVRLLTEQGVRSPRGGLGWHPSSVRYILENPIYKGSATYGRHAVDNDESRLSRGLSTKGKQRVRDESEWTLISAPSIVEEAVWRQAQLQRKSNHKTLSGNPTRKYMLSGLLRCPHCGMGMSGNGRAGNTTVKAPDGAPIRKARRHIPRYRCRVAQGPRVYEMQCPCAYYDAANVEALVLQEIYKVADNPQRLADHFAMEAEKKRVGVPDVRARRQNLQQKLNDLKRRSKNLVAGLNAVIAANGGRDAVANFTEDMKRNQEAIDKAEEELKALDVKSPLPEKPSARKERVTQLVSVIQDLKEILSSPLVTPAEKHDLLSHIIVRIEVPMKTGPRKPIESVTIYWKTESKISSSTKNM